MSTLIMSQCWPLQMPPTAKAVLISLADNANDNGACWPAIATIAMRTCFSERAVQNAIKWLESVSALRADRSNGRHTSYVVMPQNYRQPPQEMRPAGDAPPQEMRHTPAGDASHPRRRCVTPPQEVPSNHKEPSKEPSLNRQKKKSVPIDEIVLPDWLPIETWTRWVNYRKSIKAALTDDAARLCITRLEKLMNEGSKPGDVIDQSIMSGKWTGLFPVKDDQRVADRRQTDRRTTSRHSGFDELDYRNGVSDDGRID